MTKFAPALFRAFRGLVAFALLSRAGAHAPPRAQREVPRFTLIKIIVSMGT